jgi:hypothetical protein
MNKYETEAHMRQANPYLANHLATIAILADGIYTATTGGKSYQWKESK